MPLAACADAGFVRICHASNVKQTFDFSASLSLQDARLREKDESMTYLKKLICCYIKINSSSVFADSSSGLKLLLDLLRCSVLETRRNSRTDCDSLIKLLHYQPQINCNRGNKKIHPTLLLVEVFLVILLKPKVLRRLITIKKKSSLFSVCLLVSYVSI